MVIACRSHRARHNFPGKTGSQFPPQEPPAFDAVEQPQPEPAPVVRADSGAAARRSGGRPTRGIIDPATPSSSQGPGTDGGAGTGKLDGVGPDRGSGLGTGPVPVLAARVSTGQRGDGSRRNLRAETRYTADAMRARVQGKVWVECVVQTNGICTDTRVTRSLDPTFGLDQEAVRAVRLFRFRPGMRRGEPVPVLVTIELTFSLH